MLKNLLFRGGAGSGGAAQHDTSSAQAAAAAQPSRSSGAGESSSSLLTAAKVGNCDNIRNILKNKSIDINSMDAEYWTACHYAAHEAVDSVSFTGATVHLDALALLIKSGADPRLPSKNENTPLHYLCQIVIPNQHPKAARYAVVLRFAICMCALLAIYYDLVW